MAFLRTMLRTLFGQLRASRNERRRAAEQRDDERFADRQARHKAGIYEPPHSGGGL